MKNLSVGVIIATLLSIGWGARAQQGNAAPCDPKATAETQNLFKNMQRLAAKGIMFGHHDDTGYGVKWQLKADSSDVKAVTGSYPAVYGWDVAKMEHDSLQDINGIPFNMQRKLVKEAYQRGGVNTFCWHMDNPVNGKTAWDSTANILQQILADGDAHTQYVQYLDRVATYFKSLKGDNGEEIPILFRPFHELTGKWFWWGTKSASPEEFVALWKFTIDYLRKKKKVHNLLVVYSTADYNSAQELLARYPGDGYVDFMGFDLYCDKNLSYYTERLDKQLSILQTVAAEHHKVACIPETGFEGIPDANWWTDTLLPVIARYQLAYVMAWRNANPSHYFAPFPGQLSAANFIKFYKSPNMIFQDKITHSGIYGKN